MDQSLHSHQLAINHGKEFKVTPSACKMLATVLRGSPVVLPVDFLEHGLTFTAEILRHAKKLATGQQQKRSQSF
jgi:hypothetical protein